MVWFFCRVLPYLICIPKPRIQLIIIKKGWHVTVAYIVGFFVMIYMVGWHPHAPHKEKHMQQEEVVLEQDKD